MTYSQHEGIHDLPKTPLQYLYSRAQDYSLDGGSLFTAPTVDSLEEMYEMLKRYIYIFLIGVSIILTKTTKNSIMTYIVLNFFRYLDSLDTSMYQRFRRGGQGKKRTHMTVNHLARMNRKKKSQMLLNHMARMNRKKKAEMFVNHLARMNRKKKSQMFVNHMARMNKKSQMFVNHMARMNRKKKAQMLLNHMARMN